MGVSSGELAPHPPGGWRQPLPRERPLLEHVQAGTMPGSQRLPAPTRVHFRLPSPGPADAAVHILYLLLFLCCVPLHSPWEEPTGWQLSRNLLSPLWVPASPLISAWTPCARVRPLRDLVPAKAASVPASHLGGPSSPRLIIPVLQRLRPGKGEVRDRPGREEEWPQERQKLRVGWLQGENNSMELPLQAS